jgi:hypothetical protein
MYHWRTPVKVVTTFRVPYNENFFTTENVLLFKNDFAAQRYLFNQFVVMLSHIAITFMFNIRDIGRYVIQDSCVLTSITSTRKLR